MITDQELADAIRNSPYFKAGWLANPPENSLGNPVSLRTAEEFIARAVRTLLEYNPQWVPTEGEKVEWREELWTVEHVHNGHAYLLQNAEDPWRYRAPLSELTRP